MHHFYEKIIVVKRTKEELSTAIECSISIAGALRHLGLRPVGGNYLWLKNRAKKDGIATSHFLGQATNRGSRHKGGCKRRMAVDVLVCENKIEKTTALRRCMFEVGFAHKCCICMCPPLWQGKPLVLHIDHKNGNREDNRRENLRFLCPNCHSQTDTYCSKNIRFANMA